MAARPLCSAFAAHQEDMAYLVTCLKADPLATGYAPEVNNARAAVRAQNDHWNLFLVADEVGLGKTIETALLLRELASRGELRRALLVVPAGLVNNWHREMNEVFRLDFEVFGSEGDVTDRRSNAFMKHDLLIASIYRV